LTSVAYGRYHSVSEGGIVRADGPDAALYEIQRNNQVKRVLAFFTQELRAANDQQEADG
jgi:hypothetical protein